jgi:dienelactone hydrolase
VGKEGTDHIAVPLAEAGFVTFSPDAIPSGERRMEELDRMENAHNGSAFWGERLLMTEYLPKGLTILGAQMWDLMRAIDILQSIPQVDRNNIGSIGGSQGGIHSLWIGALDERVKAVFCGSGAYLYRTWEKVFKAEAFFLVVPGILKHTDIHELVALTAPRSFIAYSGEKDPAFTPQEITDIERFAEEVYALYGAEKNLSKVIHKGEHCDEFKYPDWDKYIAWFREAFSRKY